jgi:hypothetical protein
VIILEARRVLSADKRGSSWPVLIETDAGLQFTKLRGAAQGTGALVAEVIVAELAGALGLRVPARSLVLLPADVESLDQNDELADLLCRSAGINLGFAYFAEARGFVPTEDVARVSRDDAAAILWLDGLTSNPDRTARNPNLLWQGDDLWLIDHGAALSFQYSLPIVDPASARRPYTIREPHLLQSRVSEAEIAEMDLQLASRITRAAVEHSVASVPNEFLIPLFDAVPDAPALEQRRAAYVDHLSARLEAPRPFLAPVVLPSVQRRRGRPEWLAGGR